MPSLAEGERLVIQLTYVNYTVIRCESACAFGQSLYCVIVKAQAAAPYRRIQQNELYMYFYSNIYQLDVAIHRLSKCDNVEHKSATSKQREVDA